MNKLEYLDIVNDIINDDKFQTLKNEVHHHNSNRFSHNICVSYNTYKICKRMHLDYVSATRGALLHDFFFDCEFENNRERILKHPKVSLINSLNLVDLSKKEMNIIESHMYPIGGKVPRYLESVIVDLVDDCVSIKEKLGGDYKHLKAAVNFLFIIFTSYLLK